MPDMLDIMDKFRAIKVLVVGDIYLDEQVNGEMTGISTEGPMPVVRVTSRTFTPGGASNIARGIVALGGECAIAGFVGDDTGGSRLLDELARCGVDTSPIVTLEGRETERVTRISASSFHDTDHSLLCLNADNDETDANFTPAIDKCP